MITDVNNGGCDLSGQKIIRNLQNTRQSEFCGYMLSTRNLYFLMFYYSGKLSIEFIVALIDRNIHLLGTRLVLLENSMRS